MGKIINVEESLYTNDIIEKYTSTKVGQYCKYLSSSPTFITYYSINQVMSKTDKGTGAVATERGYNSPLRFNKIIGLPAFNIPTLNPDIVTDENGTDIELDISDVTLLPNTITPTVPDYFCISLPNSIKMLFRVNNFRYTSIQSNDYITIDADLKATGPNADESIECLVVETYTTVFDNIGTADKCFIRNDDIEKVKVLGKIVNECIDTYRDMHWDVTGSTYVSSVPGEDPEKIYDYNLIRFIRETDLFPNSITSMTILQYNDFIPKGADMLYKQSLLYAVQHHAGRYLAPYMYYYPIRNQNPFSTFNIYKVDCRTVQLQKFESLAVNPELTQYYDGKLISNVIAKNAKYEVVEGDTHSESEVLIFDIIQAYMMDLPSDINIEKLVPVMMKNDRFNYFYMPLVIYILTERHAQYFKSLNS